MGAYSFINPLFDAAIPFNYWQGIIAPRDTWERDDELVGDRSELKNWGYRVKVRIEGVHPADKNELPDDQLPWINITLGSSGSGHKRTGVTPGITQGSQVWGIWANPERKENPIYIGTIGNNDQLLLPKLQPDNNGFIPYSGYTFTDIVAGYSIPALKGKPLEGVWYPNIVSLSDKTMMKEPSFPLQSPTDCEKVPMTSIQKSMQELIQKIERATDQLNTWEEAAQNWISEKQTWINEKVSKASEFVTLGLKNLFKDIRKFVEEKINEETKKLYELINPPDRDKAKVAKDALIELIVCLFNKMIGNLKGMVGNFLTQMLDRYINVPACAVQNFVASLLGNVLGALSGAINSIINKLSSLIGGAFSIANSILGILGALAGFFACEEDQECPETKEWNIFEGSKPPVTFNIDSIINQAKSLYSQAENLVDIDNLANVNFDNLIGDAVNATNPCNVGPLFCGPPKVTFWGGGGSGAVGNAIVSATGDILGIDLIASGLGYKKAPSLDISDNCGKGGGVRARVIMEPDGGVDPFTFEPTQRVQQVIIEDPGSGFIPTFNGDLGGDGRVWAPKDWTVVKTPDGRWKKYPPEVQNDQIISEGSEDDQIIRSEDRNIIGGGGFPTPAPPTPGTPPGGAGGRPNSSGGINDRGIGQTEDQRIADRTGITRIPGTGVNGETEFNSFPTLDVGSYPIILYLCGIDIENAGINYESTDKIVIKPDMGAEVVPTFGPFGVLDSIEIVKPGRGYVERPEIYIESETGYNAVLNPVLCIERIGDDTEGVQNPDDILQNVVRVVDCVGNVDGKDFAGFVNGKPYYGPFHIHNLRKMVGATHGEYKGGPHPYLYDSASESIQNYDSRFAWVNDTLVYNRTSTPTTTTSNYPSPAQPNPMSMSNQTSIRNSAPETALNTTSQPSSSSPPPPPPPPPSSPLPPSPSPSPPSSGGYGY